MQAQQRPQAEQAARRVSDIVTDFEPKIGDSLHDCLHSGAGWGPPSVGSTGRPRLLSQAIKMYNIFMKTAKKKRKPGRKPTGKTPIIALRLDAPTTARLDAWAARKGLSRSDAIRDMIEDGLTRSSRSNASELAGNQLDRLADTAAPPDEQVIRKKRLLKGPEEFREILGRRNKK